MRKIEMVDLVGQYNHIKPEIDQAVLDVMQTATFINGPAVKRFQQSLEQYLGAHVIPCANGTDALQIAMMGLGLQPGDEVITPSFTYAATAEVIALLGLKPIFVDVHPHTFNIDLSSADELITERTKAVVPVHLFGQCAPMEEVLTFAKKHNLFVVEDVAQAMGSTYTFKDGSKKWAGTMGHVGGTSFFPSKNLGCYGDGGAMITTDEELAKRLKMVSNHGQSTLYYHDIVGVNSRLDSMQAAILDIKLKHLSKYTEARRKAADFYDKALANIDQLSTPVRATNTVHVFHQYTLKTNGVNRDELMQYLQEKGIPTKVYYPVPLHLQKAYNLNGYKPGDFPISESLAASVFSLPMHTELDEEQLQYITDTLKSYFN